MAEAVLSGRYRLTERLGEGGMGVVWLAEDLVLHREVAVKTVAGPGVTEQAAARLEREARAAAGLSDSQHVVTVHDFGQDGDTLFIVMALAPGRALDRVLAAEGPPAIVHAVDWARQICVALEAAHGAGIVHRDIKPANAVLGPDGTVRVLDFGIAWFHRDLGLDRLSQAGGVLGSAPWMSPEQARGEEVGPASDLYSLGCLLHQLLAGKPPFGDRDALAQIVAHAQEVPDPPSAHRPGVPVDLDLLVAELLSKSPEHRPDSAAATVARLGAIARELGAEETTGRPLAPPIPAALPRAASPAERPVSRRTLLVGAVGLVAVSTTAIVVVPNVLDGDSGNGNGGGEATYRWRKQTLRIPTAVADSAVITGQNGDDSLVAYDVRTGEERWRGSDDIDATYPMTKDTLYVTANGGELRCLEPDTGEVRWSFEPLGDDDVSGSVFPVLVPECVYVGLGPYVYSLDHSTGEERWRYMLEEDLALVTSLESGGGLLFVRDKERAWIALDPVAGSKLWTWQHASSEGGSDERSFVGAVDGRAFFSGGSGLTVLDTSDGRFVTTYRDLGDVRVVPEHRLLLGAQGAWSATDGTRMWSAPKDFFGGVLMGGAVVGNVYDAKAKEGYLVGLDPRDGKERWRHKDLYEFVSTTGTTAAAATDSPLIAKVLTDGVKLLRIDPATGRRGPVRTVPESYLLWTGCLGNLVFAVCADSRVDPETGTWPKKRRLYTIELAQFDED